MEPSLPADARQPLTGYRVLDLSGPMGVYCGKLLADMGADVVKVEPPGGDPMRRTGPFLNEQPDNEPPSGHSLHWLHFNTNKRGVTLDIATLAGAALLRRMAAGADVLLETFSPRYLESLDRGHGGLGYDQLAQENPGLIYASITPFLSSRA